MGETPSTRREGRPHRTRDCASGLEGLGAVVSGLTAAHALPGTDVHLLKNAWEWCCEGRCVAGAEPQAGHDPHKPAGAPTTQVAHS